MIRFIVAAALALLIVAVVALPVSWADGLIDQRTYDGWYQYRANTGLFWHGGQAYNRTLVTNPGYYTYGCYGSTYYPGSSYYTYSAVYPQQAQAAAYTPPAYAPGWKGAVLKYAEARDDAQLYSETLRALGFNGQSYSFQQYGAYTYSPLAAGYTPQGATQYGYSVQQAREAYGFNVDLNKLAQMQGQMTAGAQALAGQSATETTGVVNELGKNARAVAEILAKGQAGAQLARSLTPTPSTTTTTTVTGTGVAASASVGPVAPPAVADNNTQAFLSTAGVAKCITCHGGNDPKAKFDIVKAWPALTSEQRGVVMERIFTRDPEKHMPQGKLGKDGDLTPEEKQAFVNQLK